MSCCGGNCGCGSGCKCGNGCGGCNMYPGLSSEGSNTTTATIVTFAESRNGSFEGFEMAAEGDGCNCSTCKCGSSCSCPCCGCN